MKVPTGGREKSLPLLHGAAVTASQPRPHSAERINRANLATFGDMVMSESMKRRIASVVSLTATTRIVTVQKASTEFRVRDAKPGLVDEKFADPSQEGRRLMSHSIDGRTHRS